MFHVKQTGADVPRGTLEEADRRYVWHPFTQMQHWVDPLVIVAGEGSYLIDADGRRYLDGVSSLWVNVHGHSRPEIVAAIQEQAATLAHSTLLGLANAPSIQLAEALVRLAPPGLTRVFYSDSGSTAVEVALKIAYQTWLQRGRPGKHRFVHLKESYHGDTIGAVAVGGIELFHSIYGPLLRPGIPVENPRYFRNPHARTPAEAKARALSSLEQVLKQQADQVAAVIIEPLVQGAAGMLVQPPGYLAEVAALCRKHDVFLIADEVATGFGRTGTLFACEQERVTPDLLCLAKGITGGTLPLAATLATESIYETFLAEPAAGRAFYHGHTYTGNPIACAAALASLGLFDSDQTLARLRNKIELLQSLINDQLRDHPHVGDIRQRGFMVGIELVERREDSSPFATGNLIGHRVAMAARSHGVILRPLGDTLVLLPPLSISHAELAALVLATRAALDDVLP